MPTCVVLYRVQVYDIGFETCTCQRETHEGKGSQNEHLLLRYCQKGVDRR